MAVLKVIEILASSPVSWEDAAASAVKTAGRQSRRYAPSMFRIRVRW
jgi:flavin-binding protein dodecin